MTSMTVSNESDHFLILQKMLRERNAMETQPFVSVYETNANLQALVDTFQLRCATLEQERNDLHLQYDELREAHASLTGGGKKGPTSSQKNEARLLHKVEKLQEQLNGELRHHADSSNKALEAAAELSKLKDITIAQEATITNLRKENSRAEDLITHLQRELTELRENFQLEQQQYAGLKTSIRNFQQENDELRKQHSHIMEPLVAENVQAMDTINVLREKLDSMHHELEMLRAFKKQEEKRTSWFDRLHQNISKGSTEHDKKEAKPDERKWGSMGAVIPSRPATIIQAHLGEATCVRYDGADTNLVATSGNDGTVKIWESQNGSLRATLRGKAGHPILGCDLRGELAVGSGSDKTCRVWNVRTERMIHQLVGHSNKINCARLFQGEKLVLTGSADRSLKVWDIARNTYRQTTTFRHSSSCNCIDTGLDAATAVSGHMDGGVRFWDHRTGDRVLDMAGLHMDEVTSVQFHPLNTTQILTNGKDSILKLVDIRTCLPIHSFSHPQFKTIFKQSSSSLSPDGKYVSAGSNSSNNGTIFVWDAETGGYLKQVSGHESTCISSFAWGSGGTNGQQVASVDRKGYLVLWA